MSPADVLRGAAAIVQERGLLKEAMGEPGGQRCARGAMYEASQRTSIRTGAEAYWRADHALRAQVGEFVPAWNDRPETTANDVVRMCEKTAASLDGPQ